MFDYLFFIAALAIPFFIGGLKTYRKGLVTGLMISLLYWGKILPILMIVPLGAAACIYFTAHQSKETKEAVLHVKNPALPMLAVFVVCMAIFCAFEDSFALYGSYVGLRSQTLLLSRDLDKVSFLIGPIIFGNWCDRKGPFSAAIFLTFLAEISVWCAANTQNFTSLFITGSLLVHLCTSGFFVVLPVIVHTLFGKSHFYRMYPAMALIAATAWVSSRLLYLRSWSPSTNPGSFLISLTLLTIVSAFFIYVAWRRRLSLVTEDHLQKTS